MNDLGPGLRSSKKDCLLGAEREQLTGAPSFDEIDFYRHNMGPGEVCRHDPEMLFQKEKKDVRQDK
jgi:hypothetical protein